VLKEKTLWGLEDRVKIAISRIKEFEPMSVQNNQAGYYVCVSGGKDSSVIQELCIMAGVKCEFVHNHTSADHPETVYFVRREQKRLQDMGYIFRVEIPRGQDGKQKTMWNMIPTNGLPLRNQRWCCKALKEFGGNNRYCVTGVRWAESSKRSKNRAIHEIKGKKMEDCIILNNDNDMRRRLSEMCVAQQRFVLNPIVDWSNNDVWDFLNERGVPVNPLYAQGWGRVGCIGCPMSSNGRKKLDQVPKYKAAYFRAAQRHIEHRRETGLPEKEIMETPEKYFEWWLTGRVYKADSPMLAEWEKEAGNERK
jgi:phosphoadenosine phosphosulfate reductase